MLWTKYEADNSDEYILIERWGHDHWSTFAYLETRAVDGGGIVDNRRMRCNPRLHRVFANLGAFGELVDGSAYPTRLQDGELTDHDDWSCLEDMVAAGLIEAEFYERHQRSAFGNCEARVSLTEKGQRIAATLRAHKASGGNFGNLQVEAEAQ